MFEPNVGGTPGKERHRCADARPTRGLLAAATVDAAVFALRPDYRALLLTADGLVAAPPTRSASAPHRCRDRRPPPLDGRAAEQLPHVAAWREAYRAFGAKPQRTRPASKHCCAAPSGRPAARQPDHRRLQRRLRRPPAADRRRGPDRLHRSARLVRADGTEPFDTTAAGEPVVEHPEPGEVVWRDDAGVTCRRWNWRQCTRTRSPPRPPARCSSSTPSTRSPTTPRTPPPTTSLDALLALSPDAAIHRRLLARPTTPTQELTCSSTPGTPPSTTAEWQQWLASTDRFGVLAVNNLDPAQAPLVLPDPLHPGR